MTIKLDDVKANDDGFWISLTKLTGLQIVDIVGHISFDGGGTIFLDLSHVRLSNGAQMWFGGEHDIVWLESPNVPNYNEETLEELQRQRREGSNE